MKAFFRDLPLKSKLTIIILMVSAAALLVASTAIVATERVRLRQALVDDLSTLADVVGMNTAAALDFFDRKAAGENMATLRAEPSIITAVIFSAEGEPFASYDSPDHASRVRSPCSELHPFEGETLAPAAVRVEGHRFCDDHIDVFKPIVVDNQTVGTVYIQGDLGELTRTQWRHVGFVCIAMVGAFSVAFFLSSYLLRIISKPILELADTMRTVSHDRDYSVRAEAAGRDEVGQLITGFNEMLEQIHERDEELGRFRDHLQDEVARRTAELAQARDHALAASRAKSAFVANVSHEIRTPLHAVLGHAQLLQRAENLSPDQLSALNTIEASGDHLLALINNILDLSKIEAGALELNAINFDIRTLLQELSAMFRTRCMEKKIAWVLECDDEGPVYVRGDAHKLRQVLINLVGNAVKFTDEGGLTLRFRREARDRFCFAVVDTGPGIPPADLGSLSDPFHQSQEGGLKGGTGLGLTIAKRLIEVMGGTLEIESVLGRGSSFGFTIGMAPVEGEVAVPVQLAASSLRLSPRASVNALVVDDVVENIVVLTRALKLLGANVNEATDGRQALEMVRENTYDIVFMDIRMPVMNGLEALAAIDAEHGAGTVKCVAVTASSLEEERSELLEAGFIDYIAKPFRFEEVYRCLATHLEVDFIDENERGQLDRELSAKDFSTIILPAELGSRLKTTAELYQVSDLDDHLDELEALGEEEQRLAKHLRALLNDFDMESVLRELDRVRYAG
jgi:signal transduction histidine kinase/CheY-like chemotaxis protein